jgi:predicted dehydrogenase
MRGFPRLSDRVRIGLLGASQIAPPAVIDPARERGDVLVTAVAARDRGRAKAFAEKNGIPAVADDYTQLVARDDVDLVYVGLPFSAHAEWSIAALTAGKAVLCEKCFALNAGEARAMVAAAKAADRPLLEAFHYRFHNLIRRAEVIVRSGDLGRLTYASAVIGGAIPFSEDGIRWRADQGGGALSDVGCYAVHALRTLIGAEPRVVSSAVQMRNGVDAAAEARLVFPNDLAAEMRCSMIAEEFHALLTIEGERGRLEIQNFVAPQMGHRFAATVDGVERLETFEGPSTFTAQLDHVVQVMQRRAMPLTGGADAIGNMVVLDAIRAAASPERKINGPVRTR